MSFNFHRKRYSYSILILQEKTITLLGDVVNDSALICKQFSMICYFDILLSKYLDINIEEYSDMTIMIRPLRRSNYFTI